jgi:hypothetical protein
MCNKVSENNAALCISCQALLRRIPQVSPLVQPLRFAVGTKVLCSVGNGNWVTAMVYKHWAIENGARVPYIFELEDEPIDGKMIFSVNDSNASVRTYVEPGLPRTKQAIECRADDGEDLQKLAQQNKVDLRMMGATLLLFCAECGNHDIATWLIETYNIPVTVQDGRGRSILMVALEANQVGFIDWIDEYRTESLNLLRDYEGRNVLHYIAVSKEVSPEFLQYEFDDPPFRYLENLFGMRLGLDNVLECTVFQLFMDSGRQELLDVLMPVYEEVLLSVVLQELFYNGSEKFDERKIILSYVRDPRMVCRYEETRRLKLRALCFTVEVGNFNKFLFLWESVVNVDDILANLGILCEHIVKGVEVSPKDGRFIFETGYDYTCGLNSLIVNWNGTSDLYSYLHKMVTNSKEKKYRIGNGFSPSFCETSDSDPYRISVKYIVQLLEQSIGINAQGRADILQFLSHKYPLVILEYLQNRVHMFVYRSQFALLKLAAAEALLDLKAPASNFPSLVAFVTRDSLRNKVSLFHWYCYDDVEPDYLSLDYISPMRGSFDLTQQSPFSVAEVLCVLAITRGEYFIFHWLITEWIDPSRYAFIVVDGLNLLHLAAIHNHLSIVKYIVVNGIIELDSPNSQLFASCQDALETMIERNAYVAQYLLRQSWEVLGDEKVEPLMQMACDYSDNCSWCNSDLQSLAGLYFAKGAYGPFIVQLMEQDEAANADLLRTIMDQYSVTVSSVYFRVQTKDEYYRILHLIRHGNCCLKRFPDFSTMSDVFDARSHMSAADKALDDVQYMLQYPESTSDLLSCLLAGIIIFNKTDLIHVVFDISVMRKSGIADNAVEFAQRINNEAMVLVLQRCVTLFEEEKEKKAWLIHSLPVDSTEKVAARAFMSKLCIAMNDGQSVESLEKMVESFGNSWISSNILQYYIETTHVHVLEWLFVKHTVVVAYYQVNDILEKCAVAKRLDSVTSVLYNLVYKRNYTCDGESVVNFEDLTSASLLRVWICSLRDTASIDVPQFIFGELKKRPSDLKQAFKRLAMNFCYGDAYEPSLVAIFFWFFRVEGFDANACLDHGKSCNKDACMFYAAQELCNFVSYRLCPAPHNLEASHIEGLRKLVTYFCTRGAPIQLLVDKNLLFASYWAFYFFIDLFRFGVCCGIDIQSISPGKHDNSTLGVEMLENIRLESEKRFDALKQMQRNGWDVCIKLQQGTPVAELQELVESNYTLLGNLKTIRSRTGASVMELAALTDRADVIEWLHVKHGVSIRSVVAAEGAICPKPHHEQALWKLCRKAGSRRAAQTVFELSSADTVRWFCVDRYRRRRFLRRYRAAALLQAHHRGRQVRAVYGAALQSKRGSWGSFVSVWRNVLWSLHTGQKQDRLHRVHAGLQRQKNCQGFSWAEVKFQFDLSIEEDEEDGFIDGMEMEGSIINIGGAADSSSFPTNVSKRVHDKVEVRTAIDAAVRVSHAPNDEQQRSITMTESAESERSLGDHVDDAKYVTSQNARSAGKLEAVDDIAAVELAQSVVKWLDKADAAYHDMFYKKIESLAGGARSYALSKRLKNCAIPIFESKLDGGQRILWTKVKRDLKLHLLVREVHIKYLALRHGSLCCVVLIIIISINILYFLSNIF